MPKARLVTVATLLLVGCVSTSEPTSANRQAEISMRSAFDLESRNLPGDCLSSLNYQLDDAWDQFRQNGVTAASEGVFLFLAGDSYLWVAGLFAGPSPAGHSLVLVQPSEDGPAQSYPLTSTEYNAILKAAIGSSDITPSLSSRSHDPCEYLVVRDHDRLTVRAGRQALSTDAKGLENEGGFRAVRELFERSLESKTGGDRK